jgi:plasmid stabilization system protein ParE
MVKNKLVWARRSQQHMRALYKYINNDSPQNALSVVRDIIVAAEKAITNPEYYSPDKYKIDNDGSHRAFKKYLYRIGYRYRKILFMYLGYGTLKWNLKITDLVQPLRYLCLGI